MKSRMRLGVLAVLSLLALEPVALAQRAAAVDRKPVVVSGAELVAQADAPPQPVPMLAKPQPAAVVKPPVAHITPTAVPVPTAQPAPTEPQSVDQAVQLAAQAVALFKIATVVGTAAAWAAFGLAVTYLLLFALKKLLKDHLVPDKYAPLAAKVEAVLVLVATAFGYYLGGGGALGAIVGLAAGLGSAFGGSLHKVTDWIEAQHKKATS